MLEVKGISCGYDNKNILQDVGFTAKAGDIICILGPNGSGKTTLIKTIIGLLKPYTGQILVDGCPINNWTWRRRAKLISYIPQSFNSTFQYRCEDMVLMGRTSYINVISSPSDEDKAIAKRSMETLNIYHLKDKIYSKLSGGERQLVKIAQALTQESKIIVMDEPTNNLDFGNQLIMLRHIRRCADMGMIIIMATHLPEHALLYATKALLVKDGKVIEIDTPSRNLREDDLIDLYHVDMEIVELSLKQGNTFASIIREGIGCIGK